MNPLDAARREAGLSPIDLWLRYFALGGDIGITELEAYLAGALGLPDRDEALIGRAINESLVEEGVGSLVREPQTQPVSSRVGLGAVRLHFALARSRSQVTREEATRMRERTRDLSRWVKELRERVGYLEARMLEMEDRRRT